MKHVYQGGQYKHILSFTLAENLLSAGGHFCDGVYAYIVVNFHNLL